MKIITISREYGAGGHSVGTRVAEQLGVEIYDEDIIGRAVKLTGINEQKFRKKDESISRFDTFLRGITPISYEETDAMFRAETQAILEFAKLGPCVILGRCGDVILKSAGYDILRVYLYADYDHRKERVSEMLSTDNESVIRKAIHSTDTARHAYYAYYTDKDWGNPENYDLMLNTGVLGYDTCIKLILEAAKAE